jgi:hypothetical protein
MAACRGEAQATGANKALGATGHHTGANKALGATGHHTGANKALGATGHHTGANKASVQLGTTHLHRGGTVPTG